MLNRFVFTIILLLTINSMSADNNVSTSTISSDSININKKSSSDLISRNIFVELGGPSYGIGIGYDQRFKPNSVFGFRAGLAYINGSDNDNGWFGAYDPDKHTYIEFKGITLPLEINAIMGKRASKFELGLGATPCILDRYESKYRRFPEETTIITKGIRLNIFGTINIGYRLQRKSGFFLRTGLTLLIGDIEYSPFGNRISILNLSLGYTIR